MNKATLYREFLPKLIRRMAFVGLPSSVAFLLLWYRLDMYVLYGHFLDLLFSLTSSLFKITFEAGDSLDGAAFFYTVVVDGVSSDIGYKLNNHSPNMVVLVLLVMGWPHKDKQAFFKLALLSFLLLVFYQMLSTWTQVYYTRISPGFADRNKLFWQPSLWHSLLNRVVGFDKFILRYYAAFPIFGLSLAGLWFGRRSKPKA